MANKAIFFDSSRCSGCKACMVACKCWNLLPSPLEQNSQKYSGTLQNPADLEPNTRLIITYDEKARDGWGVDWAMGRRACMHCSDAACVDVCPSESLFHDEETGMVTYDASKCIGCQYCRSACPFDVPRHTGVDLLEGDARINKCTGCVDRIKNGRAPACVTTCQPGALEFGDRDELLRKAHERVDYLHAKGFEKASVYGEHEMGGTHVIYVLKYGIEQYGLPENPQKSAMVDAMGFMKPLTAVGTVAVVAGLGLCFLSGIGYHRDKLRYDEVTHDVIDEETGEVVKHINKEAGER